MKMVNEEVSMVTLNSILISSEDSSKLISFYKELFQGEPAWSSPDGNFVGWKLGHSYFTVGPHDQIKGTNSNPARVMVGLESTDVEAEFQRAIDIEGASAVQAPYHPNPKKDMWVSTISDPDGNYIQIMSPFEMDI